MHFHNGESGNASSPPILDTFFKMIFKVLNAVCFVGFAFVNLEILCATFRERMLQRQTMQVLHHCPHILSCECNKVVSAF